MSFMGKIETRCPHGCEPFTTPVWSFVNAVKSPELRDTIKALELNLLLCPGCGKAFPPEATWIYYEPALEILAFVFPESYKSDEAKWRGKMEEDYAVLRESLGGDLPVSAPPELFFGQQGLADLLEFEDFRTDERDVMEHYAADLGLSLYKASPAWAREHGAPRDLPYKGAAATRESVIAGIKDLLAANDRLTAWEDYRKTLEADPAATLPPPAR
ncbi:MAG: CpXC domain-containing protein [Elusimicrobiota bacterium]|nr:CpXC domain-containing protein [Elusimicrobiota bacterium]